MADAFMLKQVKNMMMPQGQIEFQESQHLYINIFHSSKPGTWQGPVQVCISERYYVYIHHRFYVFTYYESQPS